MMTERIPFAQFVLNEIEAGEVSTYWGGERWAYARKTLKLDDAEYANQIKDRSERDRDDWTMRFKSSWLGMAHRAVIYRGPKNFEVVAKGKQWRALRDAIRVRNRRREAEQAAKDAEHDRAELDAAWWP